MLSSDIKSKSVIELKLIGPSHVTGQLKRGSLPPLSSSSAILGAAFTANVAPWRRHVKYKTVKGKYDLAMGESKKRVR